MRDAKNDKHEGALAGSVATRYKRKFATKAECFPYKTSKGGMNLRDLIVSITKTVLLIKENLCVFVCCDLVWYVICFYNKFLNSRITHCVTYNILHLTKKISCLFCNIASSSSFSFFFLFFLFFS